MRSAKEHGAIAILDALGASSYSDQEIGHFLASRERALEALQEAISDKFASVNASQITTFTFNDTVIIAMRCGTAAPSLDVITTFAALLRRFLVDSMTSGLLFRGSAALGMFYVDEDTNTVLGDAVTDAAQWYERCDWAGVHFTPRSYLELKRKMVLKSDPKRWAMIEYDVPLHGEKKLLTFAINWPKIFLVRELRPWNDDSPPRTKLLKFLSGHKIPFGTEQKYFNTLSFFDYSVAQEERKSRAAPRTSTR